MEDIKRGNIRTVERPNGRSTVARRLVVPERRMGLQISQATTYAPTPQLATPKAPSVFKKTLVRPANPVPGPAATPAAKPIQPRTQAASPFSLALPQASTKTLRIRRKKLPGKRFFLSLLAAGVLGLSGYASFDALSATHQARAQLTGEVKGATASTPEAPAPQAEGTDEKKPPVDALKNYRVASALPRAIYIDKLDVKAKVLRMGIDADGALKTPINIYDTGWYEESTKPGEPGAMLIDGHASGPTNPGVFLKIGKLVPGDTIRIERGDGKMFTYGVQKVESIPAEKVAMDKLLSPITPGKQGLNLISCTGKYDAKKNTYADRSIVYATLQ